jgi:hypothetical protein
MLHAGADVAPLPSWACRWSVPHHTSYAAWANIRFYLQMERFREESRQEEQRRAAAVAAREEAEQKVAELEAAVSEKAAALQAAEEESAVKAVQAAEQVCRIFAPV